MFYYKIMLLVKDKKYEGIRPYSTANLENAKAYFKERAQISCGSINRIYVERVNEHSKEVQDYLYKRLKAIKTLGAKLH